jgi:hypothetical protein
VALDSAGNVFIADFGNNRVVELPKTLTGYGSQVTLPFSGLSRPYGDVVDNAGDVFVSSEGNNRELELQRQSVNFGSAYLCSPGENVPAPCNQTLSLPFIVTASGALDTPVVLTGGAPDLDFTLAGGSTCTGEVTAGTSCTVNVTFTPTATGVRNGTVEIVDFSGTVIATLPISGIGVAVPPIAQLSTTLLQFGTIPFGTTETYQLTVTNIGAGTLTIDPSIAGQSFVIAGSTCAEGLMTDQSCSLTVEFSPVTAGAHNEALTVQTNGPTNPTVGLVGVASADVPPGTPPKPQVSTTYLPFGTVSFGTTKTLPVTVTNIGGGTLTVAPSIGSYGTPPRSPFSYAITSSTCGGGVTSGNSCVLQVEFSPMSIGTHTELLALQTNGAANPTVGLHGVVSGLSVLGGVSGAPLQFGSVTSGSTEVETLTVTNVGLPGTVTVGTAITVRATTTPTSTYTILTTAQNTCLAGIAAGHSCTLPVEFAPTSSGTHDDLLTLTPSAGGGSTNLWLLGTTP